MKKAQRDTTQLICDIGELSGLFTGSTTLETFLQRTVEMIAHHMGSDVCSIYLYFEDKNELVLSATTGLNKEWIGKIKLKFGEGLTGFALKELRAINERNASKNLNFRYFPGLGEERFESFLAVPIVRGTNRIGVIVVQNTRQDYFSSEDIKALKAITSQLANTVEMTRLIMSVEKGRPLTSHQPPGLDKELKFIKGKVGSDGFAHAQAVIFDEDRGFKGYIQKDFFQPFTLEDFHKALRETENQLESFQNAIEEKLADVASLIFSAQILMLKDKAFIDSIEGLVKTGMNVVEAVVHVIESYVKKFESIPNAYLREKAQDVRDIGQRLLDNLIGKKENTLNMDGRIVIARELFPSDALKFYSQNVAGIILLTGGVTSHLSILAQSLKIPLIIADKPALLSLPQKTRILLDAEQGNIYVDPPQEVVATFKDKEDLKEQVHKLKAMMSPTTETKDGARVNLLANINLLGDLQNAREFKAEGIGLYRTEFPFIIRSDFPSEEEQIFVYQKLVQGMPNKEITFRTLDIGGDKVLSYFDGHIKEKNPYLGMRSIRFSLQHVDIFEQQLRAILRAGKDADIRIMFPMISSLDEFAQAKAIVSACIQSLNKEKIPCHQNPAIGLMIELPSVLEIIDDLAQEADFFSIGTNDFIQYMLAVDRTNERVADLYLPHHPSVLRALKKVVDAAHKYKKDVSVCGDMAQDVRFIEYFLGIGVKKLSLNPSSLPKVQEVIKSLKMTDACKNAQELLAQRKVSDIQRIMKI